MALGSKGMIVAGQRIIGLETEYGIANDDGEAADPIALSNTLVAAHASKTPALSHIRWDYGAEHPFEDALHPTEDAIFSAPTISPYDERSPSVKNALLANGGRLYVDHAHPEYATPEVRGPLAAVVADRAGESIVADAAGAAGLRVFKNNVDGKGASYGMHENYLVDRAIPFQTLVEILVPFLVTRQIVCGAGRVGLGPNGERAGFQISQRADYIETLTSIETTARRPIINTRDEPHADGRLWRRLHVILGDANMFETSTFLKVASLSAVLDLATCYTREHRSDLASAESQGNETEVSSLALADPIAELHAVSRDLDLTHRLTLRDGRALTAIEIQERYISAIRRSLPLLPPGLQEWADVLYRLAFDRQASAQDVEWIAKYRLLDALRRRDKLDWDAMKLAAFDLQWAELDDQRGLARRLLRSEAVNQISVDSAVKDACGKPPSDTRAYFRASTLTSYATEVVMANWESVTFRPGGVGPQRRVMMTDPTKGTKLLTGELLSSAKDLEGLLRALAA